jgi:hypothetical protein
MQAHHTTFSQNIKIAATIMEIQVKEFRIDHWITAS